MKSPKELRRDIQDLSEHLQQVQRDLQSRATINIADIGKECQLSADALKQLLEKHQVPGEYKVAVVGRFKAGKSTFVNELLDNRLASEGTLPETAGVSTFKHGSHVQAHIRFLDLTRWDEFKKLHTDDPAHPDAHRVSSWMSFATPRKNKEGEPDTVFDLQGLEQEHLRQGGHTVTLELPAQPSKKGVTDLQKKIKNYTSASSPLHCLVDSINITAPAEILDQGVLLIDTPGLDDTDRFRVTLTEKVVADVDAVLFLTKSGAAYGQSEKDFLLSLLRRGTVKQLMVVVTHIDETYRKVIDDARDKDETPEPIADCIAREHLRISGEIAATLQDLEQDDSLLHYQEQLGEVHIVFTSARLHRDWKAQAVLPFEITPSDPGGLEKLKADLLEFLSTESRLAQTAENIIEGASQHLQDLQSVLQNKQHSLQNTQNDKVAEQKLANFESEFHQACIAFDRTVEQHIQSLTEALSAQAGRDESSLSKIAKLAEKPLADLEASDTDLHWRLQRNGQWGHLTWAKHQIVLRVFPKVQKLLNDRTSLFSGYTHKFEEELLRLAKNSEDIAARLELGTSVYLDVSDRLKEVLARSMRNAQNMIASEERKVQQLLDDFVKGEVANRIEKRRQRVAEIAGTGTVARQNQEISAFYADIKSLLQEALKNYLTESSRSFSKFLLTEAKEAPRNALGSVKLLLKQAADNIVAAATLHLTGQTQEATAVITSINDELMGTLERFQTIMPKSPPLAVASAMVTQTNAQTLDTLLAKAAADVMTMTDSADWAHEVQAAATVCIRRLQLHDGSTGWSYEKLFESRFLTGALQLSLIDPHLSRPHQLRNLQEFLMHVAEAAKPKAIEIVTSHLDGEILVQQNRVLDEAARDLFQQFGVALTVRRENGLHDRYLRLNHGVLFKLGRGLDVYKPATGLAVHRPAIRRVRATEIDVFVVPGHTLTTPDHTLTASSHAQTAPKRMKSDGDQLALAAGLTAKTNQLCLGLESGAADILERVTPTTADLLAWWFGEDMVMARGGLNFHAGQKQAILNAIVAHEVLGAGLDRWTLLDLYQTAAPDALLTGTRLAEVSAEKHGHPKYCLKMATGTGKTWVLQALMIWQLLNKNAALAEGIDDPRFTRQFMVVAPGLIVYERLLDAFCGKLVAGGNGSRDFASSDMAQFADLFIPEAHRESVFAFVRGNVCSKNEIGLKATGNGMIAITNWHLLAEGSDASADIEEVETLGTPLDPQDVVAQVLPLTPGRATGNSLDVLDRRYARGNVLEFLAQLPELMVFNDEAHHIHEFKREGETTEVEWQKSLSRIAQTKGRRFVQVDFSATPYNDVGSGRNKRKVYFPHIVTDFDLKSAMRAGLVKSLVLDRRKEIGALPLEALEFKAERDESGNPALSEGQRVMLRAGLAKLRKLEKDFAAIDPHRHPKMLVVCEDTTVSPLVAEFLRDQEGLNEDEVMTIDSGKKAELGEKDWAPVRERLFSVDHHATPRVIVSVLMLREGFDVNNICVIVPLRSNQAQILLEQTIGRGLRLMWRDAEYNDIKRENRELIEASKEPGSLLDVLSIVEHPAFQSFYDELIQEGLMGTTGEDGGQGTSGTGDVIAAELREGFEAFDFGIPFILQEADELRDHKPIDVTTLPAFTAMPVDQLKSMLGKGDTFVSQDLQSATLFGDYRVDGAVMNVSGYNEYLSRLTRRISQALSSDLPKNNKVATHLAKPYLQVNTAELTGWIDDYVWTQLFAGTFNPMEDENWRLLLLPPVMDHITKVFAMGLLESEEKHTTGQTEVHLRYLSEVPKIMVRASASLEVSKCIYTRMGWPSRSGGLERAFIHWAQADTQVLAFCKISENRHTFARLRYVKDDGLPAFYSPDFLVRTAGAVYLVETKGQEQTIHPNVQRKLKAALAWCDRINNLTEEQRGGPPWHYVLLGEAVVYEWQTKKARLAELLEFARLRPLGEASLQQRLI